MGQSDHTPNDIIEWNSDNVEERDNSDQVKNPNEPEDSQYELAPDKISHQCATNAFNTAIKWSEQNNQSIDDNVFLQNVRNSVVKRSLIVPLKQSKIINFATPE